jgi:hypothetical protein
MWRYWVGAGAALVVALAAMFLFRGSAASEVKAPPAPVAAAQGAAAEEALPEPPSADARTREQKRFDRIDKDRDDAITKDEFFALRRKAFARLDTNHDGKLGFDEWAIRGVQRFGGADRDKSGALDRKEFETTALKRKPPVRPRCDCAPGGRPRAIPPRLRPPLPEGEGEGEE